MALEDQVEGCGIGRSSRGAWHWKIKWRGVALEDQVEGRGIGRSSGGAWHWKIKWRGVALEDQVEGRGIGRSSGGACHWKIKWRGVALEDQVEGRGIGRSSGGAWHWKIKWRGVALEDQVEGRGIRTGQIANVHVRHGRSTTKYIIVFYYYLNIVHIPSLVFCELVYPLEDLPHPRSVLVGVAGTVACQWEHVGSCASHVTQHGGEVASLWRESTQTHLTHENTKAVHINLDCLSAAVVCADLRSRVHSCPLCRCCGKVAEVGRAKVRQFSLPLPVMTNGFQEDIGTADVSVDDGGVVMGVQVGEGRGHITQDRNFASLLQHPSLVR